MLRPSGKIFRTMPSAQHQNSPHRLCCINCTQEMVRPGGHPLNRVDKSAFQRMGQPSTHVSRWDTTPSTWHHPKTNSCPKSEPITLPSLTLSLQKIQVIEVKQHHLSDSQSNLEGGGLVQGNGNAFFESMSQGKQGGGLFQNKENKIHNQMQCVELDGILVCNLCFKC